MISINRRHLLLICLSLPLPADPPTDPDTLEFYRRVENFDRHYQAFINRLCNWPGTDNKCRADLGHIDSGEFYEARKAAKKLFGLEDKK